MEPVRFKPEDVIRQSGFNHELAKFLVSLELSGEETVEWIVEEVYFHLKQPVIGWDGNPIDINLVEIESLFGEEARRYVNGYKLFAHKMPRQKLQKRCVERIAWVDVARTNYLRRNTIQNE